MMDRNEVDAEALSDWLDFRRDYEPVQGVDFDYAEPAEDKPRLAALMAEPSVWGRPADPAEDEWGYPVPF